MKLKTALVAVALAISACGGDNPAHTQVRIIIQSDLGAPAPIRQLRLIAEGDTTGGDVAFELPPMPFLLAVSPDSEPRPFTVRVLLSSGQPPDELLVVRAARDVPFVRDEARMLVLPVPGKCACHGTSCPPAGDPDCEDIVAPALTAVDEVTAGSVPDWELVF
jgi:hypothetical protein